MRLFFTILLFAWVSGKSQNMPLIMQFSEKIIASTPIIDTTYSDTIQIITGSNAPSVAGWTTLSNSGSAPHSVIKTATVNGKTFSTQATANWPTFGGNTANNTGGENTDDGGGFHFPAAVQLTIIYANIQTYNGTKSTAQIKISGLIPGQWWINEIVPSRDVTGLAKEGYAVVHDADGQRDIRTYSDGSQDNRAGTAPTGNGVYFAGNTSKYLKFWSKADSNGEIYIAVLGTSSSTQAQQVLSTAGYRGYKATITP